MNIFFEIERKEIDFMKLPFEGPQEKKELKRMKSRGLGKSSTAKSYMPEREEGD